MAKRDNTGFDKNYSKISKLTTTPEKISWYKKMNRMLNLTSSLSPIEEQIIELQAKKIPIFDEVQKLRKHMIETCIHADEYISKTDDGLYICNFCNSMIKIKENEK